MAMNRCYRVVVPTMLLALMLVMLPLPDWAQGFRPDWLTLFLIYWVMAMPERLGIVFAWVFGLLLDVTQGAILGQHAVALVLVAFFMQLQYQRIRMFALVQQALVVFAVLVFKQLIVLWISGIVGQAPEDIVSYFIPSVVGAAIWPWVFVLLRDLRRRFTLSKRF
jgi:rod shape-determining protein MreD